MTLPVLDGLVTKQAELKVTLMVTCQPAIELKAGHHYRCGWVFPTELTLTYSRSPGRPHWKARWGVRGRKLLKRGEWSEHIGAYVSDWDVDQTPHWVADALHAHHPDPPNPGRSPEQ
ncbi:hypothetical protein [Nonomuraea sp. NPDC049646]|uniref:hypothetical protein n=1 Tax=unclassified Nonomuraea TaxID=2593643 RepID=UPI00379D55D2